MFPIRKEIEALPADKVCPLDVNDQIIITSRNKIEARDCSKGQVLGWKVYETIGVSVINAKCLSKLTRKSVIVGE